MLSHRPYDGDGKGGNKVNGELSCPAHVLGFGLCLGTVLVLFILVLYSAMVWMLFI